MGIDPGTALLLLGAAAVGGALNAVAGGGSFFTFPALVFAGIPAVPANATSTLALWPGSLASVAAYRNELGQEGRRLWGFGLASLLGGVAGAALLVHTPSSAFERLVPFLLLAATLLFTFGPGLTARLRVKQAAMPFWAAVLVQGVISVYGGYFGGGMGMMMLAAFALLGMGDLHRMNGLKALLAVVINGVALATFVAGGIIAWRHGLLMTVGAIVGGYGGAALARRVDPRGVRLFIITSGFVLSAVFFGRAFLPR
jgi:uncharacterized membrane protein YfcA